MQLDFMGVERYILTQSRLRFARPFPSLYVAAEGHRLPIRAAFCRFRRHMFAIFYLPPPLRFKIYSTLFGRIADSYQGLIPSLDGICEDLE